MATTTAISTQPDRGATRAGTRLQAGQPPREVRRSSRSAASLSRSRCASKSWLSRVLPILWRAGPARG